MIFVLRFFPFHVVCLISLTNAFNCVSFDLLLRKLQHYVIRDSSFDIIHYLNEHKQCVKVIDILLNLQAECYFRPISFYCYDERSCFDVPSYPVLYADDTSFLP